MTAVEAGPCCIYAPAVMTVVEACFYGDEVEWLVLSQSKATVTAFSFSMSGLLFDFVDDQENITMGSFASIANIDQSAC